MRPLRTPVNMSIFELLKAGPGPSSSHTMGPMLAGADFAERLQNLPPEKAAAARGIRVRLLGALSATGKGHGTDRAVIAGLMGYKPDTCPPTLLDDIIEMPRERLAIRVGGNTIPLLFESIEYGPIQHSCPYSNTLLIDLLDIPFPSERWEGDTLTGSGTGQTSDETLSLGRTLGHAMGESDTIDPGRIPAEKPDPQAANIVFSMEYYSVGGGFLQWKGWAPPERGRPAHPYTTFRELIKCLDETGLTLHALMQENEAAITGMSVSQIHQKLDGLLDIMKAACRRGCATEGALPGPLGLRRKAPVLYNRAVSLQPLDRKLCMMNAYAYATAEENAAGRTIVTAPTCGASGVVPAMIMFMQEHLSLNDEAQRNGLLAAVAIGFLAKHNAAIAGAEVGCQGEVGVASAMAAAMLAHSRDYSPAVVENAAEIALEHHLGLTCDPVGGYVQIPCIERNAMGVVKAYNAALIACNENPLTHMVSFDDALKAMAEIGADMSVKYKETSTGGLAACMVYC